MDFDLDGALRRLAAERDHAVPDGIENAVLARIHDRGARSGTGMVSATFAAIGAVMLGVLTAGPTSAPPAEASPLAPFGLANALAPSTMLLAGR